uniref:J domain-containing protein n=1 Tax=Chrysotila carterae TaxID=13221 RepID=A0A7S4BUW2_CHRCT
MMPIRNSHSGQVRAKACSRCMADEQKEMLRSAAHRFYAKEGKHARGACAATNHASGVDGGFDAAFECQRVLRLPDLALPAHVLGLPHAFDPAAARKRFRQLARVLHPDKCPLPNAETAFKRINDAFQAVMKARSPYVFPDRSTSTE